MNNFFKKILLAVLIVVLPLQGIAAAAKFSCALKHLPISQVQAGNVALSPRMGFREKHPATDKLTASHLVSGAHTHHGHVGNTQHSGKKDKCDACALHCHANVAVMSPTFIDPVASNSEIVDLLPASFLTDWLLAGQAGTSSKAIIRLLVLFLGDAVCLHPYGKNNKTTFRRSDIGYASAFAK